MRSGRAERVTVRPAMDSDIDAIWANFHVVVSRGDTYAFSPDCSPDAARRLWMRPGCPGSAQHETAHPPRGGQGKRLRVAHGWQSGLRAASPVTPAWITIALRG
jgi:hypothetical protein